MNKDVSVIIPNWNGRSLLEKNLPIVCKAAEHSKNKIGEIIIVDDKSTDDSIDFLKKNFQKSVKIVAHTKNRGFAAAVNTGVRSAKYPYVCLLNTDVIPNEDFLESALTHFNDPKVIAVTLHEKGRGYALGTFRNGFFQHTGAKESRTAKESFWASGGSSIFSRDLWIKCKGFDEKLFSPFYWEDVDLGYRAHKRGYKIIWEPKSIVEHKHESIINSDNFQKWKLNLIKERNYLIFIWKNVSSKRLIKRHRKALLKYTLRHPGYLKVVIFALLRWREIRIARIREAKEGTVSDEAIFSKFNF